MDSAESKTVSSEEALENLRAWCERGTTLLLSISSGPGKRDLCDELAGHLSYVDDDGASLTFVRRVIEPEPQSSEKTFVDGEIRFVIRLEDAAFSMLYIPQKSIAITRGPHRCVLTEGRAPAFS